MAEAVYRDYDQVELDRQVNLRARWPEHPEHFARWARDSEAARAGLGGRLDLAYGPTAGQRLDYFPARGGAAAPDGVPLLVFIHGGYWQSLDKGDFSYLAPPFVEAGIAVASLNYDLAPEVGIDEIVDQVRAGVAWLHVNARELGADPRRLYVAGHSAGGHLATMALLTDWPARGGLPPDLVKGGCSISGVYELEPIRLSYQQEILRLDPGMVGRLSPLRHVPSNAAPLICAVGSEETRVFLDQQGELAEAWRRAGLPLRVVDLPGRNHFTSVDALGERDHPLFAAVRDLVLGGASAP